MENSEVKNITKRFENNFRELKKSIELIKLGTKEVLTLKEVADYTGFSRSHLYKLTMRQEIPHYKPSGKCIYFNRLEVEQWLQSNRISTQDELEQKAQSYCMRSNHSSH